MKSKTNVAEFEQLVREHHAAVYRTALRILRDDALALDATQQTFMHVLNGELSLSGKPGLHGESSPAGLDDAARVLRCTAAREALMLLRSAASRRRREQEHAMQKPEGFEDTRVENEDTLTALRRCVAELPNELRHAIVLRFQEGLTYADVAGALEISEPSAHERVQKALDKLRGKLTRLELAALIPNLPELLARNEQLNVPASVQKKLLALPRSGITKLLVLPMAGVAASVVIVVTIALNAREARTQQPPVTEMAALGYVGEPQATPPAGERRAVEPASGGQADLGQLGYTNSAARDAVVQDKGVLEGRVVDAVGAPIEGAQVTVRSVEREGKFAQFGQQSTTGRDGAFRFELEVALASGQDYYVTAQTPSASRTLDIVRIRPGQTAPYQRIELEPDPADRPGDYELDVVVRAENGSAVAGVGVYVERLRKYENGATWCERETAAMSDATGAVHLRGKRLGGKVLRVDARSQGFAMWRERIDITEAGARDRSITLQRGLTISGSIVNDRGQPATAAMLGGRMVALYATAEDENEWFAAEFDVPGHFVIPALARVPHKLHLRARGWSAFELDGVEPGRTDLALELKARTSTIDRGSHDAEIHAACVDAATSAPIAFDILDVNTERIPDDSPALNDRDFAPLFVDPYIAQVEMMQMSDDAEIPADPPAHVFVDDGLEPGRYLVRANVEGYAPTFVGPFELRSREITSGIELRLKRGANVSGAVLDEHGQPVIGAFVFLVGNGELSRARVIAVDTEIRATASRGRLSVHGVLSDNSGRFVFEHIPTEYVLHLAAAHAEHEPALSAKLALTEGSSSDIELRFSQARAR